ncbi:c-type cytochrome [Thiogranum longum]
MISDEHARRSRWLNVVFALPVGLALAACSSDALRSQSRGLAASETQGAQVYAARCGSCHALPHPKRHSYGDWQILVPVMEQRMVERGIPELSGDERAAIYAYLRENSR